MTTCPTPNQRGERGRFMKRGSSSTSSFPAATPASFENAATLANTVPPKFGNAVVDAGFAATGRGHGLVQTGVTRVHLHVSANLKSLSVTLDQQRVVLTPILLGLLARRPVTMAHCVHKLDHRPIFFRHFCTRA